MPAEIRAAPTLAPRHSLAALFLAGVVAVLLFQQAAITLLHLADITGAPFRTAPTWPFGVPQVWSAAFWGGVWGLIFGLAEPRFPRGGFYWLAAFLFGAILLPLVGWFVVAPLKGNPIAAGWMPDRMALGMLINGIWGLGIAAVLRWRVSSKL